MKTDARTRRRLASPMTAFVLGALVLVLFILAALLAAASHQLGESGNYALGCLAFGAAGVAVAGRQPRNPMGWMLLGMALFLLLSGDASAYVVLNYRLRDGTLPLGPAALVLSLTWIPALMLLGLAALVFPDGRLPSRRWRWVVWAVFVLGATYLLGAIAMTANFVIANKVQVTTFGELSVLESGSGSGAYPWWNYVDPAFLLGLVASLLAVLIRLGAAYRRSIGERRLQEKWFVSGAAISVIAAISLVVLPASGYWIVVHDVLPVAFAALPIGLAIGILKYRLYDIDRLISRTLSYAIVTGLVVGVYVGIVTLTTKALGFSSPVAVAASTLAAVGLFNPLRLRMQHVVDRRFNRARYDAEATVATFTARLRDAVDLETVGASCSKSSTGPSSPRTPRCGSGNERRIDRPTGLGPVVFPRTCLAKT